MSIWRLQFLSDCGETPSSRASTGTDLPLRLSSSTASRRNSNEYGGVDGIDRHPLRCASRHNRQMSTKQ